MKYVIVGTAGHIDHGKSALVRALTGIDPDRLREEQLRGITIDLGFANLDLGDVQIGFVDMPGHEKFVKNMLAGVGGIDFVILVVAADESIMPQTREHFDICSLLGVGAGIVAITKTDLADTEMIGLVVDEVEETVKGSFLESAAVIPISVKTGEGIDRLKQAIHDLAMSSRPRPSDRLLRLPIDRAFSIRGFGTVVTGTLTSGEIKKDQEIEFVPGGLKARVRGVQVHGAMTDIAVAGQRTAVNLQGIDLARVERGMVVTAPNIFRSTQILDVRLSLLPEAKPLKNLVKVRFHQGTLEVLARVALINQDTLMPGTSAYAQLRLDKPVFCLHGDAFIIRRFSPTITIGGGVILHPNPSKHKTTDKHIHALLRQLDGGDLAAKIPVLLETDAKRAMNLNELNALIGMPDRNLVSVCSDLAKAGKVIMIPALSPILILPETAASLQKESLAQIEEFHKENPLQKGISREELRKRFFDDLPLDVFRCCLDQLVAQRKISVFEDTVSLYGREIQLSAGSQKLREAIEDYLKQQGFQAPSLQELQSAVSGDAEEFRRVFFWMIKEKIISKLADDLVFHHSILEAMRRRMKESFPNGTRFSVGALKELFGISRKHAIPLLEHLDREKFTRRVGNDRLIP
ncbi:MAG TPA: selenocysteine-specific translation elongation factor [Acidobacteriota bacterium]|nr:selenocysteine-specific translation elongation factor [Acidobacteriota bacterium]